LRNTLTTELELKELAIYLTTDLATFVSEFLEFFTSQYEEYVETSTFPPAQALHTVLDLTALIFEELHEARAEVMDTGQHDPGMFLYVEYRSNAVGTSLRKTQLLPTGLSEG
jgi:hypothetical protein